MTISDLVSPLENDDDESEGEEVNRYLWEGPHAERGVSDLWEYVPDEVRSDKVLDIWGVEHLYSIYRQTCSTHPISWTSWVEVRSLAPYLITMAGREGQPR